ncbi:hypothetical protein Mapa_015645 [Marchantia paleacea]|nr:hypothetical protein Mapa_015645 [Marchantia paleacea]
MLVVQWEQTPGQERSSWRFAFYKNLWSNELATLAPIHPSVCLMKDLTTVRAVLTRIKQQVWIRICTLTVSHPMLSI